ncbi:MAG: hypothetical protein QOK48_614 [Blastocatellia bacterium]|nr:hypothetical protein [Blastocatellia bacterium]
MLARGATTLFHWRLGLDFDLVISWRAFPEPADVPFGAMLWPHTRSHHLGKKINVVICFARHRLANLVQHRQELWSAVQIVTLDCRLLIQDF